MLMEHRLEPVRAQLQQDHQPLLLGDMEAEVVCIMSDRLMRSVSIIASFLPKKFLIYIILPPGRWDIGILKKEQITLSMIFPEEQMLEHGKALLAVSGQPENMVRQENLTPLTTVFLQI